MFQTSKHLKIYQNNNQIKSNVTRVRVGLTSGGIVGHTENGEAVGALDVEDVPILRVGHVHVVVPRYLLEDLPGDRAGVRRRGAELRQHHRSPSHQSIQNRHLLSLSLSPDEGYGIRNEER